MYIANVVDRPLLKLLKIGVQAVVEKFFKNFIYA